MTPLSQNCVKKTQISISSTTGGKKIKIRNYNNFGSNFFLTKEFLNFETSTLVVTSLFQIWNYQDRTYIWDTFFNFLKLQVLINDLAGYLKEELPSGIPVFTEHHQWLIINIQAYYNGPVLANFDKIVQREDT